MEKIIVEIFNSHGVRQEYREFYEGAISIGRGYLNDIIVTDPYVSSEHIILRHDDEFIYLTFWEF